MPSKRIRPWWSDSTETASGISGAIHLAKDDPALVELRQELKREVNLPEELTQRLVSSLSGVSYLGSLLRVDAAIEQALRETELVIEQGLPGQGNLFHGFPSQQLSLSIGQAKATVLDRLESFLSRHSSAEDLGLRLDGEQLAAGVRFVRLAQEGRYDIVVGNPPYQGLSKTAQFEYVTKNYARGKADLCQSPASWSQVPRVSPPSWSQLIARVMEPPRRAG